MFPLLLLNALLMVAIPLADAGVHEHSPATLLVLYVAESFLLVLFIAPRTRLHRHCSGASGHYLPADLSAVPPDQLASQPTADPSF